MTMPLVRMRGEPRISKGVAWTVQQILDIRSIWDDIIRSVNGGVTQKAVTLADDTELTPVGSPNDISIQVNTQAMGNLTVNAPLGTPTDGQFLEIILKSTAVQTFIWDAIYADCTTTTLPVASTGGGSTDKFFFQYSALSQKWEIYNAQYGYA